MEPSARQENSKPLIGPVMRWAIIIELSSVFFVALACLFYASRANPSVVCLGSLALCALLKFVITRRANTSAPKAFEEAVVRWIRPVIERTCAIAASLIGGSTVVFGFAFRTVFIIGLTIVAYQLVSPAENITTIPIAQLTLKQIGGTIVSVALGIGGLTWLLAVDRETLPGWAGAGFLGVLALLCWAHEDSRPSRPSNNAFYHQPSALTATAVGEPREPVVDALTMYEIRQRCGALADERPSIRIYRVDTTAEVLEILCSGGAYLSSVVYLYRETTSPFPRITPIAFRLAEQLDPDSPVGADVTILTGYTEMDQNGKTLRLYSTFLRYKECASLHVFSLKQGTSTLESYRPRNPACD